MPRKQSFIDYSMYLNRVQTAENSSVQILSHLYGVYALQAGLTLFITLCSLHANKTHTLRSSTF